MFQNQELLTIIVAEFLGLFDLRYCMRRNPWSLAVTACHNFNLRLVMLANVLAYDDTDLRINSR